MKFHFRVMMTLFAACTMTATSVAQTPPLSKYDQLKAATQKICPVSGEPLGRKGQPWKVRIGDEEIFLCCKSCTKRPINKDHWVTIHKNFAKAQGICPVMEKPLPANPKSTVVNGQTVYICCPPCSKKIQAEPRKYLTKLAGYYQLALKSPPAKEPESSTDISKALATLSSKDRLHAAVQRICPVSGRPLGAMGTPFKVQVGKMNVFLCCEGCKGGQINKKHWATIAQNIKSMQSKCPVMEKALPAQAKSIIVDGQLVFVCCPPCTKKIAAEQEKYLAKVDGYLMSSLKQRPNMR